VDHAFPHYRRVLSPVAIRHGYFINSQNPAEEHINEQVHWSAIAKRSAGAGYSPVNLPQTIEPEHIADITPEERALT
jgi:hypothetical protein